MEQGMSCNVCLTNNKPSRKNKKFFSDFQSKVNKTENHVTAKYFMVNAITFTAVYSTPLPLCINLNRGSSL
jgi:hypothetical protein